VGGKGEGVRIGVGEGVREKWVLTYYPFISILCKQQSFQKPPVWQTHILLPTLHFCEVLLYLLLFPLIYMHYVKVLNSINSFSFS